jgi:hypothetical protein
MATRYTLAVRRTVYLQPSDLWRGAAVGSGLSETGDPPVSTLLFTLLAAAGAPLVSGAVVWVRNEIGRRRFMASLENDSQQRPGAETRAS